MNIWSSAPIATRRKNYGGYRELKLRTVGRLRLQGGRPNARTSSRPRTLNHETTENGVTADDDRKSRASGLANHRVVNEARSAQRD